MFLVYLTFIVVIVMAGSTSTAVTITNIFAFLCRKQSQIRRLQKEVDECWKYATMIEVSALGNIVPY